MKSHHCALGCGQWVASIESEFFEIIQTMQTCDRNSPSITLDHWCATEQTHARGTSMLLISHSGESHLYAMSEMFALLLEEDIR